MVRFVWTRLIHAPIPSKLIYVDYYWLKNCDTGINVNLEPVKVLASFSYETRSFSPNFSYNNRTIATPFLSTSGLEDPLNDKRILGNCVYSPIFTSFGSHSFTDFFTGANVLGFYDINIASFDIRKKPRSLPGLSKYAVVKYYVVNISGEKRISRFFDKYEEVESFAKKFFMGSDEEKVKNFFVRSVMFGSIRSCIRRLKHPTGFFAHVQTMAGSINASELLLEFKRLLMYGGDIQ